MLFLKVINPENNDVWNAILMLETEWLHECLIGRTANCHLPLDSLEVSYLHAKIRYYQGEYYFSDLRSTAGSRLNNQDVQAHQTCRLKARDFLQVGNFMILVEAIDPPAATTVRSEVSQVEVTENWSAIDLPVRCVRVIPETTDVKTFCFMADQLILFDYQPGQFVTLTLEIEGEIVCRSYSICSSPSRPHTLDITIKRVPPPSDAPDAPAGLVSNWLHDQVRVGSQIKISGPYGNFSCCPDPPENLLLISAGSGITPMLSMARWLHDRAASTHVIFFHCARTLQGMLSVAQSWNY
jgi:glycine betaine catabolism B